MKTNTPQVQIEAWAAKEKLYELVKHLSPSEQIKKLMSMGKLFFGRDKKIKEIE